MSSTSSISQTIPGSEGRDSTGSIIWVANTGLSSKAGPKEPGIFGQAGSTESSRQDQSSETGSGCLCQALLD